MNEEIYQEKEGNLKVEVDEIKKIATSYSEDVVYSTTTHRACSGFFTILCC